MDYQVKKQINILIQLAMSDREFTDSEKDVIVKIGRAKGCLESEIRRLIDLPDIQEALAPMTLTQKMDFLLDSVAVVLADDKISDEEEAFARQIATKVGFREEVIKFLIEYQTMDRKVLKDMMIPYLVQDYF